MIESFLTGAVGAGIVAVLGNLLMWALQRKATKEDKKDLKIAERLEAQEQETKVIKAGLEAILHDRLYEQCTKYIKKGEISSGELKNVEYLYTSYHDLGGNGTGTTLFERTKTLKLSEETDN